MLGCMLMTWGLGFCLGSVSCETVSVPFAILRYWSVFIEMSRVGLVLGNLCLISLFESGSRPRFLEPYVFSSTNG